MQEELFRLATFSGWPGTAEALSITLARNGFIYSGEGDLVTCHVCRVQLDKWSRNDDPMERHRAQSPGCAFVCGGRVTDKIPSIAVSFLENKGTTTTDNCHAANTLPQASRKEVNSLLEIYKSVVTRARKNGIFGTSLESSPTDRTSPDYDKLRIEEVRLGTFHDWPHRTLASPQSMAQEGLFYTGVGDRVQCAFCHGFMMNWKTTDLPATEHRKHFPQCPFVLGHEVGNVPRRFENPNEFRLTEEKQAETQQVLKLNCPQLRPESCPAPGTREQVNPGENFACTEPPKHPGYSELSHRIQSFRRGIVPRGQTIEAMAAAGWFFTGPDDKVKCFQCGGNLKSWEPDDDPWNEHRKWYKNCPFLKTHAPLSEPQNQQPASQTMVATAVGFRVEPREVKARMDTAKVRAILNMGYSKEVVKELIETRLSTTGDDFPTAEAILEALFLLDDTQPGTSANFSSTMELPLATAVAGAAALPTPSVTNPSEKQLPAATGSGSSSSLVSSSSLSSSRSSSSRSSSSRSSQLDTRSLFFADVHSEIPFQKPPCLSTSAAAVGVESSVSMVPVATGSLTATKEQPIGKGKRKKNKKRKSPAFVSTSATGDDDQTQAIANQCHENLGKGFNEGKLKQNEIHDAETLQFVEENRQLREARTCKVCMDAEVNTVFLPCGHLVCCDRCAPQLRDCPMCRTYIRGTVKTFLS